MKKIFLIDPLSPWGHRDINEVMINILKDEFELHYCSSKNYLEKKYENVFYYEIDERFFKIEKSSLKNRIRLYKAFLQMLKMAKKINPDYIFVMSYDTIVTFIINLINSKKYFEEFRKMILLNHSNVDEIVNSKIKRLFYLKIDKNIKNIFYEEYIKEKVLEYERRNNYYVLPHSLNEYKLLYIDNRNIRKEILEFFSEEAIYISSTSNNEINPKILDEIELLNKNNILSTKQIKFFIKNKRDSKNKGNVYFFKGFLNEDEYRYILNKTTYVFLAYDIENYKYRVSGVYFDSITFEKPVIYNKTKFFIEQKKFFGEIGIYLNENIESILDLLQKNCKNDTIRKIKKFYSNENILKKIKEIIG